MRALPLVPLVFVLVPIACAHAEGQPRGPETFGPAFAQLIGESELLRATAREALVPLVEAVR